MALKENQQGSQLGKQRDIPKKLVGSNATEGKWSRP